MRETFVKRRNTHDTCMYEYRIADTDWCVAYNKEGKGKLDNKMGNKIKRNETRR